MTSITKNGTAPREGWLVEGVALRGALDRAAGLFETIGEASRDGAGWTRDAFGPGEQTAHDIVLGEARQLGLEIHIDAALNAWMTLPGRRRDLPAVVTGSHLDSVPNGGNFDGLAGVLAGLAAIEALIAETRAPWRDITLVVLRGEENAWFGAQHVGSRAALGMLTAESLDGARRVDTGRSLREHMRAAGADLSAIAAGQPLVDVGRMLAFIECHIEQGPVLIQAERPVGLVTAIRGNRRFRDIVCRGEYGHSGVVPRVARRDAVFATAEFATCLDSYWSDVERSGGDLVATIGRFTTDPAHHGVTVVPGEVRFSLDLRSHRDTTLEDAWAFVRYTLADISNRRGVIFELAPETRDAAVELGASLRGLLAEGCDELGIPTVELPSGAGHDVADFAMAGVPAALVFIRNANGSHNPAEAMDLADFGEAVRLLTWTLDTLAKSSGTSAL